MGPLVIEFYNVVAERFSSTLRLVLRGRGEGLSLERFIVVLDSLWLYLVGNVTDRDLRDLYDNGVLDEVKALAARIAVRMYEEESVSFEELNDFDGTEDGFL